MNYINDDMDETMEQEYNCNTNIEQGPKTPNMFQQFVYSFVPPKYKELARAKVVSMILLVCILVFLAGMLLYIQLIHQEGGLANMMGAEMSDFPAEYGIKDGELYVEEDYYSDEDNSIFYITDDVDRFYYEDVEFYLDNGYEEVVLMGRYNMCKYEDGVYKESDFAEYEDEVVTKDDLINEVYPLLYVLMVLGGFILCLGKVGWYFFGAAVLFVIGILLAKILKRNVNKMSLFKVAVYAKIPFFIVANIISAWGINFSKMAIPRELLTVIFLAFCIGCLPQVKECAEPSEEGLSESLHREQNETAL